MPAQPYVFQPFPSCRYGPNGESEIFEKEEDVPEGWLDHPAKFNAPAADTPAADAPAAKAEGKPTRAPRKPKAEAVAKPAEPALEDMSDEELETLLKGYGYEVDGAAREDIIAVIRDERAKA